MWPRRAGPCLCRRRSSFPISRRAAGFATTSSPDAPASESWPIRACVRHFSDALRLAAESTGSSTRIARAILVDVPPSIDLGEVTDKGSLNQRVTLQNGPRSSKNLRALAVGTDDSD